MSYSFSVQAGSKAEAIEQVKAKMADVVAGQPSHSADQAQAIAAAEAFIGVLGDDPTRDVSISLNGSIWSTQENVLRSASVAVQAGLVDRN